MVVGNPAEAKSINAEGLRRRGFSNEEIATITKAYKLIYRRGLTIDEALTEVEALLPECQRLMPLIQSIKESTRGIVR